MPTRLPRLARPGVLAVAGCLATQAVAQQAPVAALPQVDVIGSSPLLGSGVDRNKVPAKVDVVTPAQIDRNGTAAPDAVRALSDNVAGVNLDDASGNPFQPTLFYHGFEASPLQGTPQGLAVYVGGVRFNQPFGDTVNWDLLPGVAIDRINVEGSNPVFGLNALGGALNVRLKDGFTYQGAQMEASGGSFGSYGGNAEYGVKSGNMAAYAAINGQHQDGWRDGQSSDVRNFYGDVGWRTERTEIHLNLTLADTRLNGPGTSPVELLAADAKAQFTAPNRISNKYLQLALSGSHDFSDALSLQGVVYYDNFHQVVVNGNAPANAPCTDGSGLLCSGAGYSTTLGGGAIPAFLGGNPTAYAELDNQSTNTNGYGAALQMTATAPVFGLANHFVAGVSFDGAQSLFSANGLIGGITPDSRVFVGPGVVIDEPGTNAPVRVSVSDANYAVFLADTLNLTDRLAVTASGRFNAASIDLADQNGGDLSGNHSYIRFNPAIGASYRVAPWLVGYAGYAEANRAPTPAELSCASPADSCSLANFFVGDPALKQVVAHTVEAGLRGTVPLGPNRLHYDVGLFRSDLNDDIVFVNSVTLNRAYFTNVGQTRRQGVDARVDYVAPRWSAFVGYSYTDATYQSGFVEAGGNNPAADANGNLTVRAGDRLPGVPAHQVKLGASYTITDRWVVQANAVARSGSYLFGDASNSNPKLPGYFVMSLGTRYRLTPNVEVFGSIENVTDAKYYTFGTFAPTTAVYLAQAPNATNPRAYSPAAPIGGFGGVRVRF